MKHIVSIIIISLLFFNCKSQDLLPFRMDTLWGYKDKQGVIKIQPQFQYASKFIVDIAIVAKNEKFGAIDKSNNLIVPLHYEYLRQLDTAEFLFGYKAKYFGEHIIGVLTKDEKIKIPAVFSYITKYRNTYTVKKNYDSIIGKNGMVDILTVASRYGLFDNDGKLLVPCKFNSVSWLNDTLIMVDSSLLSADGKYLTPNYALFNINGKQLTEFKYMVFGKFAEGVIKARIGNKFGFIFSNGRVAIPIKFDYCEDFKNGYALIKHGEYWGAINKKGQIKIKPIKQYQEVMAEIKEKYGR